MAALPVLAAAGALVIHSQVSVDAAPGIQAGETGLIIESLTINPTRTKLAYDDHMGRRVMSIYKTPMWAFTLNGKTTLNGEVLPSAHPGTALTLAEFASLNAATANGFPRVHPDGFISINENTRTGAQGDLWGCAIQGELCWLPTTVVTVFRVATEPPPP